MNTSSLLTLLSRHIGAHNGMTAAQISSHLNISMRRVRHMVSELREEGTAVCAHPTTGYFVAANDEELNRYYLDFIKARSLHGLRLIAIARKISLPDLIGQIHLPT